MPEKEYIERGKVHICLDDLSSENLIGNDNDTFISLPESHDRIDDIPTADVAEVVRCKDCIYQDDCARQMVHTTRDYVLEQNISTYKKVDFCSCGERK